MPFVPPWPDLFAISLLFTGHDFGGTVPRALIAFFLPPRRGLRDFASTRAGIGLRIPSFTIAPFPRSPLRSKRRPGLQQPSTQFLPTSTYCSPCSLVKASLLYKSFFRSLPNPELFLLLVVLPPSPSDAPPEKAKVYPPQLNSFFHPPPPKLEALTAALIPRDLAVFRVRDVSSFSKMLPSPPFFLFVGIRGRLGL